MMGYQSHPGQVHAKVNKVLLWKCSKSVYRDHYAFKHYTTWDVLSDGLSQ
jgi:hypothetical protein